MSDRATDPKFYARRVSATEASAYIYGLIGSDFGGITSKDVVLALAEARGCKKLNLFINSPGGDLVEGKAIFSTVKRLVAEGVEVVGLVDSEASSAASVVAMACSRVVMSPGSIMMVHEVRTVVSGPARALEATLARLKLENANLVEIYAEATGLEPARVAAMLDAETTMTAEQAVELGFADSVEELTNQAEAPRIAAVRTTLADFDERLRLAALRVETARFTRKTSPSSKTGDAARNT